MPFVGLDSGRPRGEDAGHQDRCHLRPPVRPGGRLRRRHVGVSLPSTLFVDEHGTVVATSRPAKTKPAAAVQADGALRRVIDGAFAYALTAGMVATVNPCGFAMLPAYLSYFLGVEGQADDRSTTRPGRPGPRGQRLGDPRVPRRVPRHRRDRERRPAQVVHYTEWLSITIRDRPLALGVAMVLGYHLPFTTPRLDKGGRDPHGAVDVRVRRLLRRRLDRLHPADVHRRRLHQLHQPRRRLGRAGLVMYGAGMALVLTALTVTLALAGGGLLPVLRRALPYVDRLAGVFLCSPAPTSSTTGRSTCASMRPARSTGGGLVSTWVEGWSDEPAGLAPGPAGRLGCCGTLARRCRRRDSPPSPWPAAATPRSRRGRATRRLRRPPRPSRSRGGARAPQPRSGSWPTTAARSKR